MCRSIEAMHFSVRLNDALFYFTKKDGDAIMTVCALLGDKSAPESMRKNIKTALTILIKNYNVNFFYVGNEGNFDKMTEEILYELCREYPYVGYNVVICEVPFKEYSPVEIYKRNLCPFFGYSDSSKEKLTEEINLWMTNEADYVVIHTLNSDSNVSRLREYAQSKNKRIVSLCCA